MLLNLPNQITVGRLVLAVAFLIVVNFYDAKRPDDCRWMLDVCTVLFIVAGLSDILDGYLARSRNQVTSLGRILDPFVDKVLICGAFAFFAGPHFVDETGRNVTGVQMWMVVLILGRELLVTGLRGFSEARGAQFGAGISGKTKMLVQSVTAVVILMSVARSGVVFGQSFNDVLRPVMVWLTVAATAFSLLSYLWRARSTLLEQSGA
ncbi:MAG: CDP-alcohol phosphatidyltransferase family protein [Phycisphaerales bacterium]|nr:MAG: CDP-alcohol phosphatidyltransferase family protein [Phycisphaerales bacterium]